MNYGVVPTRSYKVFIQGAEYLDHLLWTREHISNGTYNYEAKGHFTNMGVLWKFSNEEDAVVFALTFK